YAEDFDKLKKLVADYGSENVTVVGINLDDKTTASQEVLRKLSPPGVHLFQPGGLDSVPAVRYGVMVLPTMFLVGKDGKVVSRTVQMNNLEEEVKKLLKRSRRDHLEGSGLRSTVGALGGPQHGRFTKMFGTGG